MGLQATITLSGLPLTTKYYQEPINYAPAMEAARDTFIDVATTLVPVDTGNLRDSIHAETGATEVVAFADADYAEYVEYGTYKMSAQPYFEPALKEALDTMKSTAQEIEAEARIEDIQRWAEDQAYQKLEQIQEQSEIAMLFGSLLGSLLAYFIQEFVEVAMGKDESSDGDDTNVNKSGYSIKIT